MQVKIQEKSIHFIATKDQKQRSFHNVWDTKEILYKGKEMKGKADHSSHEIKALFNHLGHPGIPKPQAGFKEVQAPSRSKRVFSGRQNFCSVLIVFHKDF